jgi:hypothetical protein
MRSIQMFNLSLLVTAVAILHGGCCSSQQRVEPARPEKARGWKEIRDGTVVSIGMFVLKKGESTDNGELGVKVVDIIAPKPCADGYAGMAKVVLSFYRPSDKKVLCEEAIFTEGGTSMGTGPPYPHCTPEVGLSAISVNAINARDGWVWFDLRK